MGPVPQTTTDHLHIIIGDFGGAIGCSSCYLVMFEESGRQTFIAYKSPSTDGCAVLPVPYDRISQSPAKVMLYWVIAGWKLQARGVSGRCGKMTKNDE